MTPFSSLPGPDSKLLIAAYLTTDESKQAICRHLHHDRYEVTLLRSLEELIQFVESQKQALDCLILEVGKELSSIATWLHGQAIVLPGVLLTNPPPTTTQPRLLSTDLTSQTTVTAEVSFYYHTAEVQISIGECERLAQVIDRAIAQFLNLSPTCRLDSPFIALDVTRDLAEDFLLSQQRRLTEKLKERLGYLGVYYKRNAQNFLRHLPPEEQQELLTQLKEDYRSVILSYFADDGKLNQRIDDFVNIAFFSDLPVSQIVEIHMELMDEFSKQLKLEGRSEEVLLDYRLTLIDTIAHLCEMYRRSIPRES